MAAQCLDPEERDAVQGDLAEAGTPASVALREVLGLVLRRMEWQAWLASFALALPCSLLLMGYSLSVSRTFQQSFFHLTGWVLSPALWLLLCNALLLGGWAWATAFSMSAGTRRTAFLIALLSILPCGICFAELRLESVSRLCLSLCLLPAIWSLFRPSCWMRLQMKPAVTLALATTACTIPMWSSGGPWIPNWALSWPAWYLVAASQWHRKDI
ncbi:hypothetical protein [Bryobacter aggregatus]|uniref:hypothetical protein n=1 Tax=Bryobacter aggregatus TaxID=360054 RepID=UPI0004E0E09D|nr:hypothetical protein [Bryobacter aggregatus]